MKSNDWTIDMVEELGSYLKQGITYPEISKIMGKTINALRHAKSRHLSYLKRQNQGMSRGVNHYLFNGHRTHDGNGYIVNTQTGRRIHREVMEKHLDRTLNPNELIHHLSGDITDNRIENMALTNRSEHIKKHHPYIGEKTRFGKTNAIL